MALGHFHFVKEALRSKKVGHHAVDDDGSSRPSIDLSLCLFGGHGDLQRCARWCARVCLRVCVRSCGFCAKLKSINCYQNLREGRFNQEKPLIPQPHSSFIAVPSFNFCQEELISALQQTRPPATRRRAHMHTRTHTRPLLWENIKHSLHHPLLCRVGFVHSVLPFFCCGNVFFCISLLTKGSTHTHTHTSHTLSPSSSSSCCSFYLWNKRFSYKFHRG